MPLRRAGRNSVPGTTVPARSTSTSDSTTSPRPLTHPRAKRTDRTQSEKSFSMGPEGRVKPCVGASNEANSSVDPYAVRGVTSRPTAHRRSGSKKDPRCAEESSSDCLPAGRWPGRVHWRGWPAVWRWAGAVRRTMRLFGASSGISSPSHPIASI